MAGTPIILAEGVSKTFGTNQVLTKVSLPVMERDVVCVVGPSGSGKTTLLRCLALLETPSEGRVVMEGVPISTPGQEKPVKAAARAVRSEIGMDASLEASTMRKVYLRLLPFAIVCYILAYIDRINSSFAALTMAHTRANRRSAK